MTFDEVLAAVLELGKAALAKVLARLGRDKEAEAQFTQATRTIEAITANLQTPRLRRSFLVQSHTRY